VKGKFLGYRRGKRNTHEQQALLQLEGLNDKKSSEYYLGKRVAYIYKAKTIRKNSKFRVIWGKIIKEHGSNGVVRAKFKKNLPAKAMGGPVRVMLYPQHD
jgi:large subunit ribosomal protein L35Ae